MKSSVTIILSAMIFPPFVGDFQKLILFSLNNTLYFYLKKVNIKKKVCAFKSTQNPFLIFSIQVLNYHKKQKVVILERKRSNPVNTHNQEIASLSLAMTEISFVIQGYYYSFCSVCVFCSSLLTKFEVSSLD